MGRSIRRRLPLSYAAIALLAALALGTVLLTTLRGYYAEREREYLAGNAEAISTAVAPILAGRFPPQLMQSQLDSLAFLSQARVRLLDANGREMVSSNVPASFRVTLAAVPVPGSVVVDQGEVQYLSFITLRSGFLGAERSIPFGAPIRNGVPGWADTIFLKALSVAGTPLGFELNAEADPEGHRSDQVVRQPIRSGFGTLLGYVELSDGPAYGREIVARVARAWAIAGGVAVVLAATAGWIVSQRMSAPLLALAGTTAEMAEGNLSARAKTDRRAWSELELLGRSFNEMAGRVEDTILTLRRFIADATHELHTPLTALRTNLELASGEEDAASRQVFLKRAQAQVDRLEKLMAGMLDLSRLEAGATAEEKARIDLIALVQGMSELYASQAEQAGISFSFISPDGHEPVTVWGNEGQLRRALDNLIDNACKFTPEGGAVRVGLGAAKGKPGWVALWVEDTGIGIPVADLPHLFGRFHRARNAATYPGNGLGLAIVKAIVESHGGEVVAENRAPGARFTIRLPSAG